MACILGLIFCSPPLPDAAARRYPLRLARHGLPKAGSSAWPNRLAAPGIRICPSKSRAEGAAKRPAPLTAVRSTVITNSGSVTSFALHAMRWRRHS
jgi:hypothetical protein